MSADCRIHYPYMNSRITTCCGNKSWVNVTNRTRDGSKTTQLAMAGGQRLASKICRNTSFASCEQNCLHPHAARCICNHSCVIHFCRTSGHRVLLMIMAWFADMLTASSIWKLFRYVYKPISVRVIDVIIRINLNVTKLQSTTLISQLNRNQWHIRVACKNLNNKYIHGYNERKWHVAMAERQNI